MTTGTIPCGIAIPQVFSDTAVDVNLVQQFVQKAETLGYESLWVQESIVGNVPVLEPLSLLSYAAALTSRLRLGTSVMLTVLRNPVQLAKLVSSLDQLSQGRLTVGIGIGGHVPESIFGLPSGPRAPLRGGDTGHESAVDAAPGPGIRHLLAVPERRHGTQTRAKATPAYLVRGAPGPCSPTCRTPWRWLDGRGLILHSRFSRAVWLAAAFPGRGAARPGYLRSFQAGLSRC